LRRPVRTVRRNPVLLVSSSRIYSWKLKPRTKNSLNFGTPGMNKKNTLPRLSKNWNKLEPIPVRRQKNCRPSGIKYTPLSSKRQKYQLKSKAINCKLRASKLYCRSWRWALMPKAKRMRR
jgi:hypothetical protein